ncbi:IS200/IS605 family transposase ISMma22 [Moorella thermoacetica]|uniref:Transposase n=1 Tax=Neomoorella thermoacetica TaxID=1525 RepID=A0AAC9MTX3_NEOTH|nr:RNA-guided endonuclease TnpB family protein [Moorella thermoacetica]AOQ23145.1 putative transposase [Moorella thermoacetica]TYL12852.1 IS200/IS605 family transposase ISMma22 [Moorella thermoacetica]
MSSVTSSLKVTRNYKFRLYPNKEQESQLLRWLETCRWIYNTALAQRKETWERERRTVTRIEQQVWLKEAKKTDEHLREIHSQVAQEVLFRVERAFAAFFRRVKNGETPGYPRFKGRGRYKSITFTQFGEGKGASFQDGKLRLSKIGLVKIKLHREIHGTIKTVIVKRDAAGKWWAVFAVEKELTQSQANNGPAVGLDAGLEKFAALSDGSIIENPRHLRKTEKRLKHAQRNLSRKVKGSRNREKARQKLARLHAKIHNQRRDFLHKQSRRLVETYGLIAVEKLNIKGMVKNHRLAKSISDAGWGEFMAMLEYKAAEAGARLVKVNPSGTSQECSGCGMDVPKELSERTHYCPYCGLILDRDVNAARNILKKALALEAA